ncbi:hypothetical protein GCM10025876_34150 [Demequina litorisediminis]|uniref:Uncharacterized protein n=1 Tax=Demequina litorisediminis TaxID=1849022 RepID=A0ABQ6IHL8_9MICO|nr:hypothetical protein GCM10025876_34150 [Demequina litorisediminis]
MDALQHGVDLRPGEPSHEPEHDGDLGAAARRHVDSAERVVKGDGTAHGGDDIGHHGAFLHGGTPRLPLAERPHRRPRDQHGLHPGVDDEGRPPLRDRGERGTRTLGWDGSRLTVPRLHRVHVREDGKRGATIGHLYRHHAGGCHRILLQAVLADVTLLAGREDGDQHARVREGVDHIGQRGLAVRVANQGLREVRVCRAVVVGEDRLGDLLRGLSVTHGIDATGWHRHRPARRGEHARRRWPPVTGVRRCREPGAA